MADEKILLCGCGRLATKVHCPQCGSHVVLAYARQAIVIREQGKAEKIQAYRCRRCGNRFNDDHWKKECHAPLARRGHPTKATIERLFELASLDRSATLAETASALNWLETVRREQAKEAKKESKS